MRTNRLSQRDLARMAGVSRQAVGTWLMSTAIPRGAATRRLAAAMGTSPQWLLLGQGTRPPGLPYDEGADFMTQLANASEFISPLMTEYQHLLKDSERRSESVKRKMRDLSRRWHGTVREIFSKTLGKENLTSKPKRLDVATMQSTPTLSELLSRARKLTREYGTRQKLAAKLKIKPQQLNSWLSGDRKPGGDYTLKMLAVVQELEARQKQSVEGGLTPPTQKTRLSSKRSPYEKAKSDPKKHSATHRRKTSKKP